MNKDQDQIRMQLWCDVYTAYVASSNSTKSRYAESWADDALKCFDLRFPREPVGVASKSEGQ
jgi:hypothetical protein